MGTMLRIERMSEQPTSALGAWLRASRKRAGLSMDELAERAKVSKNYISVIETNKPHAKTGKLPEPSREVIISLAVGLGVPLSEALNAAGYLAEASNQNSSQDVPKLVSYFEGMGASDQDELLAIAELKWKRNRAAETTHGKKAQ